MPPKKTSTSTSAAAAAAAAAAAVTGSSGGKRRSRIQPIKDDRTRAVTLLKRRAGVFKKAFELSVLCQCDIGVIIFAPNGKLFEFTSAGDMDDLLLRYTEYIKPHEVKTNQDFAEGGDGQVGAPVQGESDDEGDTLLAPQPAHAAAAAAPTTAVAPAALHHPSQKHQHVPQQPVGAHLFAHHQQNHSHQSSYDSLPQAQQNLVRVQSQSDHQASYSQSPPQPITANPVQVPTGIAPAYQQVVPPLHSAGQFAPSEYHHQQQGTSYLAPITSPPPSVLQHGQQQQHGSYDEQQHHSRYEHSPQQHQHHQHQHHTSFPPPSVQNPATSHGGGAASGGTNGAPYDLFTSFHTTSPQTYLPPLTSARPEFAPQNSLLAAAITAPSSSSQRCESTDSRSHLTLHQEALGNSGIDPDLPTPILTPPSNNPSGHADTADSTRPSTKRDRDVASNNDRPQLAPIDAITSPTSDHPLPSPSNGPPTKRSKPNFARKTPFSLKLQIPGSSTPPTSSQNPNPTTSSTGGSRTGRESASASPSMACPPADGRGPVLLEPNPSSAGAGGPGSSPVTRSPMNATPGGSHINPFTGAPLRTSNGGGGPNSAHPASAFPLFSASTPNPGNASGYGAGGGGQSTRKSPFMHFKGTSNGSSNAPASSAYPAPISASAIPSPSGFFADRLPLPPPSSRGSGGSGNRPASSPVFPSPIPPIHGGYSSAFGSGGHHQHQHPLSRVTAGGGDTPNSDNGGGSSPAEVKREVGAPYPRPVAAAAGSSRAASDGYEVEWKREQGVGHAVE